MTILRFVFYYFLCRLTLPSSQVPVHAVLGLLLTCLYADLSSSEAGGAGVSENPDVSIQRMELVSLLFDRFGLTQILHQVLITLQCIVLLLVKYWAIY